MNCEHVFDILTRGPFPAGESTDWQVERHLAACHECRQLAEALRPAVALFHECIHSDELSSDLPGYRGRLQSLSGAGANLELGDDSGVPAESWPTPTRRAVLPPELSPELSTGWDGTPRARGLLNGWCNLPAAGLLAGLALAVLLGWQWNAQISDPQTAERLSWPSAIMHPTPDARGQLLLARLDLPADCRNVSQLPERRLALLAALPSSPDAEHPLQQRTGETYLCCTHCHTAHSRQPATARMVAATVRSCDACHQPAPEFETVSPESPL